VSMRGEAFLLSALIISVALVVIFQPIRSEYLVKQKQQLQKVFLLDIFENLFNEIKNSIYFSYDNFDFMILNSYDFLNFSEKISNQKAMDFKSLVLVLKADGVNQINATALNFLSDNLKLNLTFNDTQNSLLILQLYSINSTILTYSPGSTYTFVIQYENIERKIDIDTRVNETIYMAYVDVDLSWLEERRRNIEYFFMS
jgi:hypothetical protein